MSDNVERVTFWDGKQLWNKEAEVNNPFSPLIEDENPYLNYIEVITPAWLEKTNSILDNKTIVL